MKHAIESDFPFEEIDELAEIESYRKEINRPIYHIHKWWAKRLGTVFRAIVSGSLAQGAWPAFHDFQDYSGQVVLDPFMGSGTTLGEAAKLGSEVIGCDVNPVSTFLVKQALTRVEVGALEKEYEAIEADVKDEILGYYQTRIPNCPHTVPALYYFWVKTVTTPSGEVIPLFTTYVFSKNAYPKKKPMSQIWCPHCECIFAGMYNSREEACPHCGNMFNPQKGPARGAEVFDRAGRAYRIRDLVRDADAPPAHKLYAILALDQNGNKVYVKPTSFDLGLIESANVDLMHRQRELPLPVMKVRPGFNTNQARGYNYRNWRDFFNNRQLLCLGILLKRILAIPEREIRDQFVCLFSGTLEFNNLFCSFKGEGTGAVRHMFSNHILKPERTPLENTVWGVAGKSSGAFSSLFRSRLVKAKQYIDEPFDIRIVQRRLRTASEKVVCSMPIRLQVVSTWTEFSETQGCALILHGDSSGLPIPDESVDAVVTDPPYFDFIHYSELSDFFYAWLSVALGKEYHYLARPDSSHKNEVQDTDNVSFSTKLCRIFKECHRVLKKDALMCFSYHHSTIDGWIAIYNAVTLAGFYIVAAHPVKAEMAVASIKGATKSPINLDAILVCKKEDAPPRIRSAKDAIVSRCEDYFRRFDGLDRHLGKGDRFVIACSQAISVASINQMKPDQAEELISWASKWCKETTKEA